MRLFLKPSDRWKQASFTTSRVLLACVTIPAEYWYLWTSGFRSEFGKSAHTMHSLKEDSSRYDVYEHQAGSPLRDENLNLKVLEWRVGMWWISQHSFATKWFSGFPSGQLIYLDSVAELIKRPRCELQVIFAPLDVPDRDSAKGHLAIFEHFRFPSGFLSERIQSVSHSFGSRKDDDGSQCELK